MTALTSIESERDSGLFHLLFIYDEASNRTQNGVSIAATFAVISTALGKETADKILKQTEKPGWSLKTRAVIISGFIATLLVGKAAVKWYADPEIRVLYFTMPIGYTNAEMLLNPVG
jgi:hypothetical protein